MPMIRGIIGRRRLSSPQMTCRHCRFFICKILLGACEIAHRAFPLLPGLVEGDFIDLIPHRAPGISIEPNYLCNFVSSGGLRCRGCFRAIDATNDPSNNEETTGGKRICDFFRFRHCFNNSLFNLDCRPLLDNCI
jgi:hypothetical protein